MKSLAKKLLGVMFVSSVMVMTMTFRAGAHVSPPGCTGNNLNVVLSQETGSVPSGTVRPCMTDAECASVTDSICLNGFCTVRFIVDITNFISGGSPNPCDVGTEAGGEANQFGIRVAFRCPGAPGVDMFSADPADYLCPPGTFSNDATDCGSAFPAGFPPPCCVLATTASLMPNQSQTVGTVFCSVHGPASGCGPMSGPGYFGEADAHGTLHADPNDASTANKEGDIPVCIPTTSTSTSTTSSTTTSTSTSTSTTTTTLPVHFTCYETKRRRSLDRTVSVVDQFGSRNMRLTLLERLCNPADKNGETPGAENDPNHLAGYHENNVSTPFTAVRNQLLRNQFGDVNVDVLRPRFLFVPTAKSKTPPATLPPGGFTIDHFNCYDVRLSGGSSFTPRTVDAVDEFGPVSLTVLRPRMLCAPADKNGEDPGAETHATHLLCYKTKVARPPSSVRGVFLGILNQFGASDTVQVIRREELCVPSLKNPVSSPSGAFVSLSRWLGKLF